MRFLISKTFYPASFVLLEKWIESFFVGDSRSRSMTWIDVVVREGEELSLDTVEELFHATCR